jgi:hypothetical protein
MFVIERLTDLAADRLGLDPVALRRRNLVSSAAQPYRNPLGVAFDSGDFPGAMEWRWRLPTGTTLPALATALSEVPAPTNPPTNRLGVCSGSEGGTTPALVVVINAIVDVLGANPGYATSRCRRPWSGSGAPFERPVAIASPRRNRRCRSAPGARVNPNQRLNDMVANGAFASIAAIRRNARMRICRPSVSVQGDIGLVFLIRLASTKDSVSYGARGIMGGSSERRSPNSTALT